MYDAFYDEQKCDGKYKIFQIVSWDVVRPHDENDQSVD